jgi:hypothetical protein
MLRRPNLFWLAVLFVGWTFDFFFWRSNGIGVNFAAFLTVCLLIGLTALVGNGLKPAAKSLLLLVPFFFFAGVTFIRQEPLTIFLAYVFVFISLGLLAITYKGGRWFQYSLLDYAKKFIALALEMGFHPILPLNNAIKDWASKIAQTKGLPIKPILRGLLIALPLVIILAYLLSSADMVFRHRIISLFEPFEFIKIFQYLFRLAIILIIAYLVAGILLHAALKSRDEKLIGEETPIVRPFLGFTEAAIVLGSVVALFLLFVIIQFEYFFGGEVNIGIEGYTYSQYARSGFNELITVALISLLIALGFSAVTKRENKFQRWTYSGLSVAMLSEVIIMLVSAYQRLTLAIDWHGFSRLRLYPRVFMIWVGILFTAVILLEIFRRERYFALAAILASCGFAVTLGIFNIDGTIVTHNVFRAIQGKHFNVNHLTTLSPDAVPALVNAFNDPVLPADIHQGVGAAILCYMYSDDFYSGVFSYRPMNDWRAFRWSEWMAVQSLRSVKDRFEGYRVRRDDSYTFRIFTPDNAIYECGNGLHY